MSLQPQPFAQPIAIVGLAARFPGAEDAAAFWQLLIEGRSGLGPVPPERWSHEATYAPEVGQPGRTNSPVGGFVAEPWRFDAARFGISAGEAAAMDPQQRWCLELAIAALEDASLAPEALAGEAVGVYLGVSSADHAQEALADPLAITAHTNAGAATSAIANRISHHLDWRGPSLVIDTACSSSLVAVWQAACALDRGECRLALAGGVNFMGSPALSVGFSQALATSPTGRCAAFGAEADGMVRGEGAGVVLLKPLAQALADGDPIQGLLLGGAVNQDGRTNGISAPNPAGQRALLRQAWAHAGVDPAQAAWVEAHGTGTPLGDPIEAQALGAVFGPGRSRPLRLGSVKSNLGHLEAAAGAAGLIKGLLALRHDALPPSLHAERLSPRVDWEGLALAVQQEGGPWPEGPRLWGVSAFGFAGTNAHLVLAGPELAKDWTPEAPSALALPPGEEAPLALPLACSEAAGLAPLAQAWAEALSQAPPEALPGALASAWHGRSLRLPHRRLAVGAGREGLLAALEALAREASAQAPAPKRRGPLILGYPGMGAQAPGMGRELLAEPAFARAIAEVDAACQAPLALGPRPAWSLAALMAGEADPALWAEGDVVQPMHFALQVGLTALLASWGLEAEGVVGASVGEVAAAWACGALGLEDAARVVVRRSQLMMGLAGSGAVAFAALPLAEAEAWAAVEGAWVGAVHAPDQLLWSGPPAAIARLVARAEAAGRLARPVQGAVVASHSPAMAPLEAPLLEALAGLRPQAPRLRLWSTVEPEGPVGPLDAAYWWANLRQPVRLAPALAALAEGPRPPLLLELSPHPVWRQAAQATWAEAGLQGHHVAALQRGQPEGLALRRAAGALWALGQPLAPAGWAPSSPRQAAWPSAPRAGAHHRLPPPRQGGAWPGRVEARSVQAEGAASGPPALALGAWPALDRPEAWRALALPRRAEGLLAVLQAELGGMLDLAGVALDPELPLTSLGVGSLVGMELNNRVRAQLGVALPLALLLEGPSLRQLAQAMAEALGAWAPVGAGPHPVAERPEPLPLSPGQERMWLVEAMAPGAAGHQVAGALRLRGALDLEALEAAWRALVARHEALRTDFPAGPEGPRQRLHPELPFGWTHLDLSALPPEQAEAQLQAGLAQEARAPFDLARAPLWRLALWRLDPSHHVLALTLHHAIADGWSLAVLLAELASRYAGGPALPPLALQPADHALWQREAMAQGAHEAALAERLAALAGMPTALDWPAEAPPPERPTGAGAVQARWLSAPAQAALLGLAKAGQATPFMVGLALWSWLLARWSGQEDFAVGAPVSGRHHPGLEGLVGCLLNTLVLRLRPSGALTWAEHLEAVRQEVLSAMRHQELPFERLVEAMAPERRLGRSPLFQVAFAWHAPLRAPAMAGLETELLEVDPGTARLDLALALHEGDGGLRAMLEHSTERCSPGVAQALLADFEALALEAERQAAQGGALPLGAWPWGEPVPAAWAEAPAPTALLEDPVQAWWRLALAEPEAPALQVQGRLWRRGELLACVQAWGAELQGLGLRPGDRLALLLPRGPELAWGLLTAGALGAIAMPLEPAQPPLRLAQLLARSQAPWVLGLGPEPPGLLAPGQRWLDARGWPQAAAWGPEAPPARPWTHPAYAIFTSGSSGRPKAAAVGVGALANLVAWHGAAYGLGPGQACSWLASPGFDACLWEAWPALAWGACLVVAPSAQELPLEAWPAWLAEAQVRVAFAPTALAEAWLGLPWPGKHPLRFLLTGGDRLTRRPPPGLPFALINHYGPTECAVVTTAGLVPPEGEGLPDLGGPIAGVRLRVAGPQGQALPAGQPGELWIGGAALGLGYLEPTEEEAARFCRDPEGGAWYRSGDRVAWGPEGRLRYLGRLDDQVQLLGLRVELGEIEAALKAHPQVQDAAVVALGHPPQLWGQLVAEEGLAWPDLEAWLAERLPGPWVPRRWRLWGALPRLPSGKLDRAALAALPAPELPPTGPLPLGLPSALAELWTELLGAPVASLEADFFALGGHSLLGWRLLARVEQRFGVRLPLAELVARPSLGAMAEALTGAIAAGAQTGVGAGALALQPLPEAAFEPFPLTEVQAAYQVGRDPAMPGGGVSAQAYAELAVEALEPERLQRALDALVAHHPMLRAVVEAPGQQRILPEVGPVPLALQDLRALPRAQAEAALLAWREDWSGTLLPAERWPLFRVGLSLLPEGARLHLLLDALILDASSMGRLLRQLPLAYEDPAALGPPAAVGFREHVLALAHPALQAKVEADRAWWSPRLAELPPAPQLPLAPGAPAGPASFRRLEGRLAPEAWARLQARARAHGLSPSAVMLTLFAELLAGWSAQPSFTLNLPSFRPWVAHEGVEALVGDFTALLPVALRLEAPLPFLARAQAIQAQLWAELDHGAAGGLWLLRRAAQLQGAPVALPVVFTSALEQGELGAWPFGGRLVHLATQTPQVEWDHQLFQQGGALHWRWDLLEGRHAPGVPEAMQAAHQALLEHLAGPEDRWAEPLPWRPEGEGAPLRLALAAPPALEAGHLLPGLWAQVEARPEALALVDPERRLSYAELWGEAQALALVLREGPEGAPVALLLPSGWAAAVGQVAALLAGRPWVPLAPEAPPERLRACLEALPPAWLLALEGQACPEGPWRRWAGWAGLRGAPLAPPAPERLRPEALAYLIHTSGSTGQPKAVAIAHRAVANTLAEVNRRLGLGPSDRVLAVSALSFDLSVWDHWGLWWAGGAVVVPPGPRDPEAWVACMQAEGVSVWNSAPALWSLAWAHLGPRPEAWPQALRALMLSGDWLPVGELAELASARPELRRISLGGATEAAIWSIWHEPAEAPEGWGSVPYGQGLAGQAWSVRDAWGRHRPCWAEGDLFIEGLGLAEGYWGDPERSAAQFGPSPEGPRHYRTGDRGRWRPGPDGRLLVEFLGRQDGQVKLRGVRVELGEVEAALRAHPRIEEAIALALGERGLRRLVAAVRPGPLPEGLEAFVAERLPEAMRPTRLQAWEAWPLTPNGKVDRAALAQALAAHGGEASTALAPAEAWWLARLQALAQEVLGLTELPPEAPLMALGVASLEWVRLANRLEAEHGLRPSLPELLGMRHLREVAAWYAQARPEAGQALGPTPAPLGAPALPMLLAPEEREAFKAAQAWRRRDLEAAPRLDLAPSPWPPLGSVRRFLPEPVPPEAWSPLLAPLLAQADGRRRQASAGALYPVQLYLQARGGALWHLDPAGACLRGLGEAPWPEEGQGFLNQELVAQAQLALYLVLDLAAIAPIYGELARDFALLEAGAIAQLLREAAPGAGLGLCAVGAMAFAPLHAALGLGPHHQLALALFGGVPAPEPGPAWSFLPPEAEDWEEFTL